MGYTKDPHAWNVTSFGPINQILERLEKNRQIIIAPTRAMFEGLL